MTASLSLALFYLGVAASDTSTYKPTPVKKILIKQNAAIDNQSSGANEEDCKHFRLTTSMVKSYFKKAQPIESTHDYQWSGCKATGTIEFTNGDRGTWQINSSRLGFLTLSDHRSFSFFCRDTVCTDKPYAAWQGVNTDSELESVSSSEHQEK